MGRLSSVSTASKRTRRATGARTLPSFRCWLPRCCHTVASWWMSPFRHYYHHHHHHRHPTLLAPVPVHYFLSILVPLHPLLLLPLSPPLSLQAMRPDPPEVRRFSRAVDTIPPIPAPSSPPPLTRLIPLRYSIATSFVCCFFHSPVFFISSTLPLSPNQHSVHFVRQQVYLCSIYTCMFVQLVLQWIDVCFVGVVTYNLI